VTEEDIPVLLSLGKDHLYVWEKDENTLHKNEAAEILKNVCMNEHMHPTDVKEGKIELVADCDMDTILAKVSQVGAACHTGSRSCFFNEITKKDYEESNNPLQVFEEVFDVIKDRKVHPKEGSYTNYLFDKGIDKILKKLGEEATEIVIAAKNPNPNEVKYEISDFLYHMMVLMAEKDVTWEEITTELANR
jgi:phosphoribosyl-ATP pyrophosphohydrolase/phosphoribosyl-AMP cyclohydrolase